MRKKLTFIIPLFLILGFSILISLQSPTQLLSMFGDSNAYTVMFLLATIGGLSTFTGVPYHFILMSFAAAGLNPVILGLITAFGVMLGDTTSYMIGNRGNELLPTKISAPLLKIAKMFIDRPKTLPVFLVLYGTFSPFSNDFVVVSLGLMKYSYLRTMIPLTIGNIFYNISLAYIGFFAFEKVQTLGFF